MANAPMAEHVVNLLRRHGFEEIVVTVGFLASTIRTYFGDGSELGVRLVYATEETPLGTAGSVLNASDELDDRFLVISGDVLTDVDLTALVEFHAKQGAVATLALQAVENPLEFGIVIIDADGRVERFLEKPGWGEVFSDTINTGIYVLEPEVFDWIPAGRAVDFSSEVFPVDARGRTAPLRLRGRRLLGGRRHARGLPEGARRHPRRQGPDRHAGLPAPSRRLARRGCGDPPLGAIVGPALIGDNCRIGQDVELHGHCVLGANVRVGDNTRHRALRHPRQRLPRLGGERPGLCHRALVRRPPGRAPRRRRRARRGLQSRAPGRRRRRREGLPAQDHRGGRRRELLDHLGVARIEEPVRASRRRRHRERRPLARGRAARRDGVRDHAAEGRHRGRVARLQPGGADAEAGGHGRDHRRRLQRRGPRGRDGARDEVPDPYRDHRRRASPSGSCRAIRSRSRFVS